MVHRMAAASLVAGLLAVLVQAPGIARGAACVQACKDEIAACVSGDCQGLTKKPRRLCKRTCSKSIVRDCYSDLSVCGATRARPAKPPSGSTGSPPTGGW